MPSVYIPSVNTLSANTSPVQKKLVDKVVCGKRFVHIVQMPRGSGFVRDIFTIDGAPVEELDWVRELVDSLS